MLRDPLTHLILIGLGLYLAYGVLNPPDANIPTGAPIDANAPAFTLPAITPDLIRSLIEQRKSAIDDGPVTETEVINAINDEILLHQAYMLNLHDDAMIRERLINKSRFALEGQFVAPIATEETLKAYYAENQSQYKEMDTVSFEQALIKSEHYEAALQLIRSVDAKALTAKEIRPLQKRAFISSHFDRANQNSVQDIFGESFLKQLLTMPEGQWQGLVESKHGKHLVKLNRVTLKPSTQFDAVKAAVERDWVNAQREAWLTQQLAQKREKLDINVQEYMDRAVQ